MKKTIFTLALMLCSLIAIADVYTYSWTGKLGDNINFRLDLQESTFGTLIGEVTYFRKNGKVAKIPAYGYILNYEGQDECSYILNEYNGTKVCGTFFFEIKDGKPVGTWNLLDKELEINNVLGCDDPETDEIDFFNPATSANATGNYEFSYSRGNGLEDCGGSCSLKVIGGKINWEMTQVTPNIAEGNGTSNFNNAYFTGKVSNFEFEAYVDKKFIYVKRTDNSGPVDDWGMAATIEGIYVRVKS